MPDCATESGAHPRRKNHDDAPAYRFRPVSLVGWNVSTWLYVILP
jgi:hypothetical protein